MVEHSVPHLPSADIAIIGGSGFYTFFDEGATEVTIDTPYGSPTAPITVDEVEGKRVAFLPRHGANHEFAPHTIPYRANLWALRMLGVRQVIAPSTTGSLTPELLHGAMVVPDQLVDRTSGRTQTYFDTGAVHVQFADPYCPVLRKAALQPGTVDGGVLVVIEGPRFSTRSESLWFARQGWSLVNMTGHPEAVLARELEMCYATIALVTDLDAGIQVGDGVRAVDVFAEVERNLGALSRLVRSTIAAAPEGPCDVCKVHEGVTLPFELP
ncbi:S-methyl-5'-thioadenosine phosphorylase [Rhodococcus sp. NPDC049939]|uniref:S-methyl-5'-thioadenosine phosphorylase n=1 Tax=Rhodococcus sp. NPDC049939 TaxID=3155511 RepID=UPI0033C921E9